MHLTHRVMERADIAECVRIVATHPVIGPRYGKAIEDLPAAWLKILGSASVRTTVFEEVRNSRTSICVVGVSLFVTDRFLADLKAAPRWFGPELTRRILQGNSPLLGEKQLRHANSSGGVNLLCWEGCFRWGFEPDAEASRKVMVRFIDEHRGFRWKEVIASQVESIERLEWTLSTGGLLWNPATRRYEKSSSDPAAILKAPHIVGVSRDMEVARAPVWSGSWVGTLFDYQPPRFDFSKSEQRLLLSAISGSTDEQLALALSLSPATIKNMWRSIYGRADAILSGQASDALCENRMGLERGKEKKRHLLAYLREHPEELRPVSRKLLQQTTETRRFFAATAGR